VLISDVLSWFPTRLPSKKSGFVRTFCTDDSCVCASLFGSFTVAIAMFSRAYSHNSVTQCPALRPVYCVMRH